MTVLAGRPLVHVRVVEACRYAGFAVKSLLKLVIPGQMRWEHLQCDHPVGGGVVGAVDLPHAAVPQHIQQFVLTE